MKVIALKSFSSVGPHGRRHIPAGTIFDLPDGVDWIKAGLVKPVKTGKRESTAKAPAEKAVKPKAESRK